MKLDIQQTTTTELDTKVDEFSVAAKKIDSPTQEGENYWYFEDWPEKLGYYSEIPEYQKAIHTYATWVLGKGFTTPSSRNQVILDNFTGWGEDSIHAILWNMLVVKKINGDSFAEIVRDEETGELTNLKPLDPGRMRVVVGPKGTIIGYDYRQLTKEYKRFEPEEILHLCNDRIADQIHGTAASEAAKWVIDARNEAMRDLRRIAHRSTIRVLYVEEDDKTRLVNLKSDYAEAIKKGEVLIIPGKPKETGFQDLTMPPTQAFLEWIRYLENVFYQVVGVPKVISGGTEDNTEAGAKVGMVVFDPIYIREITDLQADLWNQMAIQLEFVGQKSMMDNIQSDQAKNTSQTGFQPNDTTAGVGE